MSALSSFLANGFGRGPFWTFVRVVAVALFAWLLYQGLAYFGHGAWMVPIALFVALLWAADVVRIRRERRRNEAEWDRWEAAVFDDARRPAAIQEAREALRSAARLGPRLRVRQAHLSVLLAELLDASGRAAEACDVLSRVKLDELDPARRGVVRHAKAVAQFSAERYDDAEATLRAHRPPSEPDIDARIELLRRMLLVERGEAEAALVGLDHVLDGVKDDDTGLLDDVRVVRAVCLEALGRDEDARAELEALDPELLAILARFGARRARALARRVARAPASEEASGTIPEESAASAADAPRALRSSAPPDTIEG